MVPDGAIVESCHMENGESKRLTKNVPANPVYYKTYKRTVQHPEVLGLHTVGNVVPILRQTERQPVEATGSKFQNFKLKTKQLRML